MSAYDKATTPAKILDSYAQQIAQQRTKAAEYENYVRTVVVGSDQKAEKAEQSSYADKKFATGVFDLALSDKLTLQQQLEKLQEEMAIRISKAKEEAKKEGKTDDEIAIICSNITNEYTDRIKNLNFNIARAGRTTLLKQKTLAEANSIYSKDHFNRISTSNSVYSGFLQASQNWYQVGKMQQHYNFLEMMSTKNSTGNIDLNG